MSTGAGGDTTAGASRYWRITVTVLAWLTIIQAGIGFVGGLLSIPLAGAFRPESLVQQLGPMFGGTNLSAIDVLLTQLRLFNFIQVGANCVICARSGCLRLSVSTPVPSFTTRRAAVLTDSRCTQ